MEYDVDAHRPRCYRQDAEVGTRALMIAISLFFPMTHELWAEVRTTILCIFFMSALGFHLLHLPTFIRVGRFTVPVAICLVLLFILCGRYPSNDWLPFLLTAISLITVGVDEAFGSLGLWGPPVVAGDGSREPMPTETDRSALRSRSTTMTRSTIPSIEAPDLLGEPCPADLMHMGPSSQLAFSVSGSDNATSTRLSHISGKCQSDWGSEVMQFFEEARFKDTAAPGQQRAAGRDRRRGSAEDPGRDLEAGPSRGPDDVGSISETSPLLPTRRQ
ncbi:hypothetical protein VTJ83DRAFT_494 [Remersonia thermophila]|uniref:Uncharacterized protein n=1 Tax=Remersonia thermophila TaxID=72144 RepID=A0ABR4DL43_9PEZI